MPSKNSKKNFANFYQVAQKLGPLRGNYAEFLSWSTAPCKTVICFCRTPDLLAKCYTEYYRNVTFKH